MCQTKRALGYLAICVQSNARSYGGWVKRLRGYWGDIYGIRCPHDIPSAWFTSLMSGFKLGPYKFNAEEFITLDDESRRQEAARIGVPTFDDLGPRESKSDQSAP